MATFSIPAGSSDAFRRIGNSAFVTDGNAAGVYNAAGRYDSTNNGYGSGLRFASVTIPAGAMITAATLSMKAYGSGSGANAKTRIRAQKADNPGVFSTQGDFDARIFVSNDPANGVDSAKVTTSVAWDTLGASIANGTTLTSPDISAVLQEIIDRPGWSSGNAIVLFWDDFDKRTTTDLAYRSVEDYEKGTPPTLTVTYTTPTAVSASDSGTATDTAGVMMAIPGSGIGAVQFGDTFTDSNGVALTSHTPTGSNPGTAWVSHAGYAAAVPYIYSNRAAAAATDTTTAAATLTDSPASADYFISADIVVQSGYGLGGVLFRHSASVLTGYAVVINGSNGDLEAHCWNAGSYVGKIASYAAGASAGNTYPVVIGAVGSRITVDLAGVRRIDVTDTTVSSAGKVGVRTTRNSGTASGIAVDNLTVSPAVTLGAETGTATETASASAAVSSTSGSDSGTGTDSSSTRALVGGGYATPTGSSLAGSVATVRALASGDGLLHNAFPGACLLPNGNHLVAYQHSDQHAATTGKVEAFVVNPSTLAVVSGPTILRSAPAGWNLGDVSCWRDGADVYMLWNESSTPGASNINTVVNVYLMKSSDNAATWGSPVAIGIGFDSNSAGVAGAYGIAANPVRIKSNGDWLLPVYGYDNKVSLTTGYVKIRKSSDKGATWTTLATINPPSGSFDETELLILDTGRIVCVMRTFPSGGGTHLYSCYSDDGGSTWTTPTLMLSNAGGRPSLHQTSTGAVLLMYRYMVGGTTSGYTHLVTSLDRCATWGSPIDPYDGAAGRTTTTGLTTPPPRGPGVYGAFAEASAGSSDAVLYWCEEGYADATRALVLARQVTTTGATGLGSDTATGTESATATANLVWNETGLIGSLVTLSGETSDVAGSLNNLVSISGLDTYSTTITYFESSVLNVSSATSSADDFNIFGEQGSIASSAIINGADAFYSTSYIYDENSSISTQITLSGVDGYGVPETYDEFGFINESTTLLGVDGIFYRVELTTGIGVSPVIAKSAKKTLLKTIRPRTKIKDSHFYTAMTTTILTTPKISRLVTKARPFKSHRVREELSRRS